MNVWAIADLHLSLSCPDKDMAVFGEEWVGYMDAIAKHWREVVAPGDLILIPGDICWAMRLEEARVDLEWVDALPGRKVIIRGNHDYWWSSLKKVKEHLPPSIEALHHTAIRIGDLAICGTRLWDSEEYNFSDYIEAVPNPRERKREAPLEDAKIFARELGRLEMALNAMDKKAPVKIVMTHYPPIGADLAPSAASKMLEAAGVDYCLFGHLHRLKPGKPMFEGTAGGVRYVLTSADYLGFKPKKVLNIANQVE